MKDCVLGCVVALLAGGCRLEMHDQPKRETYQASPFFENQSASRPLVAGTIARGVLRTNTAYFDGLRGTNLVEAMPVPVTRELLQRGRERFDIYCAVCHGAGGDGNGMIVQRGFPAPPSFHIERLREAPIGHFYRVIKDGYGVMFPYAARVPPADRWAITGYIRTLQLSTAIRISDLRGGAREDLERLSP